MYIVDRVYINPQHLAFPYLDRNAQLAKNLYNASLFRLRNHFTARKKDKLSTNEQLVENELSLLPRPQKSVISAYALQKIMVLTSNPDYYSGLPSQTAQHVVSQACTDFRNWLRSLSAWKKDPSGFTAMPRMPRYKKLSRCEYSFMNQTAFIRSRKIVLPLTKVTVQVRVRKGCRLKETKVIPYHGGYLLCLCYESDTDATAQAGPCSAAIDFGVDNTMAVVTDTGMSVLFTGGAIKSENRLFNKTRAELVSAMTKGHKTSALPQTHRLHSLSRHRQEFIHDTFQKMSSRLMEWCLRNGVSTIVLGSNKGWKQESSIGKAGNQCFVSIPFDKLKRMIRYKAERIGFCVVEQEESYTSKASFLDGDLIPVYGKNDSSASFSGYRIQRGLYKSKDGVLINADLNAAANILRKAGFDTGSVSIQDLLCPRVIGYKDLNTCIPVKRIGAA